MEVYKLKCFEMVYKILTFELLYKNITIQKNYAFPSKESLFILNILNAILYIFQNFHFLQLTIDD